MLQRRIILHYYFFLAGARQFDKGYRSQITSYDYDAALDESGDYTSKYFAIRDLISKVRSLYTYLRRPIPLTQPSSFEIPNPTLSQYRVLLFFTLCAHPLLRITKEKPTGCIRVVLNCAAKIAFYFFLRKNHT